MTVEDWTAVGIVCGALLALLTLASKVRHMAKAARRTIKRVNQAIDDLLGDEEEGVPSMSERLTQLEKAQREHNEWHGRPGGAPAAKRRIKPNGRNGN